MDEQLASTSGYKTAQRDAPAQPNNQDGNALEHNTANFGKATGDAYVGGIHIHIHQGAALRESIGVRDNKELRSFLPSSVVSDASTNVVHDQVDANPGSTESSSTTSEHDKETVGIGIATGQPCFESIMQDLFCEDICYAMNKPKRGCFIIFNQESFDLKQLPKRHGSQKDAKKLEEMAYKLEFEPVLTITNSTKAEILHFLQCWSKIDHGKYDCFACAILTHGGDRDILFARDEEMKLTDFTSPFGADMCPSLAGKPKLFFIQACRGMKVDSGKLVKLTSVVQSDTVDSRPMADVVGGDKIDIRLLADCVNAALSLADSVDAVRPLADSVDAVCPLADSVDADDNVEKYVTIPAAADFLIANSTCPDHYSFRNPDLGSLFVDCLCKVVHAYGDKMELMQIMTRVNMMMAYGFTSNVPGNPQWDKKKQIPSIETRLIANVYFPPKKTILPESDDNFNSDHVDTTTSSQQVLSLSRTQLSCHFCRRSEPPIRRTYSESRSSRYPIHKSTTEPVSIEHLQKSARFVDHRHSFSFDTSRTVVIAGRMVKSYEETYV